MHNLQDWLTVISALSAAIVSVVSAWRGQRVEKAVNAMAAAPAAVPAAVASVPGVSATDVFRFWGLFSTIASAWSAVKGMKAGDTVPVPEIKTRIEGHSYRFFGAQIEKLD